MKYTNETAHMICKKMLLQENPKALQFLHHAHGFDFEKPFFIGSIPGRFTYKMLSDMVTGSIGPDHMAAVLVKPTKEYHFEKLHHAKMNGYKFDVENNKRVSWYKFNIDYFFGVGDFEETRKHKTERVYIVAQNKQYLIKPKNTIDIVPGERYKLATTKYNNRGYSVSFDPGKNISYITEIDLQPTNGSRETTRFKPYDCFYPSENRSDNITDYIDKSGYIVRFWRLDLQRRAIGLKAEKEKTALNTRDFTKEHNEIIKMITAAREHVVKLINQAHDWKTGQIADTATGHFKYILSDWERWQNNNFSSVTHKLNCYKSIEKRYNTIAFAGGTEQ